MSIHPRVSFTASSFIKAEKQYKYTSGAARNDCHSSTSRQSTILTLLLVGSDILNDPGVDGLLKAVVLSGKVAECGIGLGAAALEWLGIVHGSVEGGGSRHDLICCRQEDYLTIC